MLSKHLEVLRDPGDLSAASFNPRTFLIDLPDVQITAEENGTVSEEDLRGALLEADTAVLRHEMVHYFQMTSTAYGVIELTNFFTRLEKKLAIISHSIGANDGTLTVPLQDHIHANGTRNLKRKLDELDAMLMFSGLRNGSVSPPFIEKNSANFRGTAIFRSGWPKRFPAKSPFARNLVYVGYIEGIDQAILSNFGAKQVLEGGAFSIDMITSRLNGSRGRFRAQLFDTKSGKHGGFGPHLDEIKDLFNPYFMAQSVYQQIVMKGQGGTGSLEELYLISELALFFDPVIMNWKKIKKLRPEARKLEMSRIRSEFFNPGEVFLNLCVALQRNKNTIERVEFGFSSSTPTAFQNSLVAAFSPQTTLEELIDNTIDYIETYFSETRPRFISEDMANIFLGMFRKALGYRKAIMVESNLMADFFEEPEDFVAFCRLFAPGYVLDGQIVSNDSGITNVGVGVPLQRLEVLDERKRPV